MTLIWLRVALVCYAAGLLYALVALTRTSEVLSKVALHASYLGMVFHFVSLTEAVVQTGQLASASVHNAESLLAFLIMVVFMLAYLVYKTTTPGIVIFPLVFLLTFVAATGQQPLVFTSLAAKHGWLAVHILMIFTGYAALFLSFGASILYLMQERALKAKNSSGVFSRLPSLQVLDDLGYKSLLLGFPFMTLGLVMGSVIAHEINWARDILPIPRCCFRLMWGSLHAADLYALEFGLARTQGRVLLATFAFVAAVCAWAANYLSRVHRFIAP